MKAIDFDTLEARVLAHYTTPGTDPHTAFAADLYGVPYEAVTPEQRREAKELAYRVAYTPTGRLPRQPEAQDLP